MVNELVDQKKKVEDFVKESLNIFKKNCNFTPKERVKVMNKVKYFEITDKPNVQGVAHSYAIYIQDLIGIKYDGTIDKFSKFKTDDEASILFWEAMARALPTLFLKQAQLKEIAAHMAEAFEEVLEAWCLTDVPAQELYAMAKAVEMGSKGLSEYNAWKEKF